ncbi:hypothetical protein ACJX0J_012784, partial [Zea mays]
DEVGSNGKRYGGITLGCIMELHRGGYKDSGQIQEQLYGKGAWIVSLVAYLPFTPEVLDIGSPGRDEARLIATSVSPFASQMELGGFVFPMPLVDVILDELLGHDFLSDAICFQKFGMVFIDDILLLQIHQRLGFLGLIGDYRKKAFDLLTTCTDDF